MPMQILSNNKMEQFEHNLHKTVVALLPGTGNTSTNTLASSQRSNLMSQRSTSLAQPIKAGFISLPLPVPQHYLTSGLIVIF